MGAREQAPRNASLTGFDWRLRLVLATYRRADAPRPCQSSLGYEPYDVRLRRLAWSLVAALTSINGCGTSTPDPGVSSIPPYPAASRAQIWLLTSGITLLTGASVSGFLGNPRHVSSHHVHSASSRYLRCCPGVGVARLSRPPIGHAAGASLFVSN